MVGWREFVADTTRRSRSSTREQKGPECLEVELLFLGCHLKAGHLRGGDEQVLMWRRGGI